MRGTAANAGDRRRCTHRGNDLRVTREAQIIIAAEVDEALALDDDFRTILINRKRLDRSLPSPQMLAIDLG
jgi:hypothetical protein